MSSHPVCQSFVASGCRPFFIASNKRGTRLINVATLSSKDLHMKHVESLRPAVNIGLKWPIVVSIGNMATPSPDNGASSFGKRMCIGQANSKWSGSSNTEKGGTEFDMAILRSPVARTNSRGMEGA
jgi:hypothetical protein